MHVHKFTGTCWVVRVHLFYCYHNTHRFFVVFFRWGSRGVRAFPRSPRSNSKNHIRLHEEGRSKRKPSRFSFLVLYACNIFIKSEKKKGNWCPSIYE
jgi:hypothetical protein